MFPVVVWILTAALAALFTLYGYRPALRRRYRSIPGPPPSWMIGNLGEIVKMGKHEAFRAWARRYGPVYKIFEGGVATVVIQDAALAKLVNSRMPNRHPIPYLESGEEERFNAAGILFARDAHHRGLRAAWQPMFHSKSLEGFMGIMDAAATRLVTELESFADNGCAIDIWHFFGDLTMRVSGSTAFGADLTDLAPSSKAFFDAAGQIENIYALLQVMFPQAAPLFRQMCAVLPTKTYAAGLKGRRAVRSAVTKLLRGHKSGTANGNAGATGVAPGSFLDLMSRAVNKGTGAPFSDMEVVCQAFSFVLAAYETSSAALAFAVHLLAANPEAQARVLAEVDAFGRDLMPTPTDLRTKFPFLEACLKESLRLYPTVPLTIREADRDVRLGGYDVPAGTHMAVSVYGLHRDPTYWKNPDSFMPERFLEPEASWEGAYMPFGEGPRGCIGQKYAWQEIMQVLVRVYQKYQFSLVSDEKEGKKREPLEVRMSLSLTPKQGVWVEVHRRRKGE